MSRLEWILGILLGLLLLATLILAFLVIRSREAPPPPAAIGIQTARTAYTIAEPVAQTWAGDATLLTAMGSHTVVLNAPLVVSNWSLIFYSPARQATVLVSVVDEKATIVSTRENSPPRQPVSLDRWSVDSQDVIDQVLATGGRDFILEDGARTLSLLLDMDGQAVWKSSLAVTETGQTLSHWLDADNGELLDIRQSE